jgi:Uma2 family endonuclease
MGAMMQQRQKLWTYDEFERLCASGLLGNARVELIRGRLIVMTPANPPHETSVGKTGDALRAVIGPGYHVREEKALALTAWDGPMPDLVVVRGARDDYRARRPTVADAVLVVEVADTTSSDDQTDKADIYAAAGVDEYWLVNLPERTLEIRRRPAPDGDSDTGWRYAALTIVAEHEVAPLPLPDQAAHIAVRDILPAT